MFNKTVAHGPWKPIETAPKTGKAIHLILRDVYGTYGFEPVAWDKKKAWVNAKTGAKVTVEAVGWRHLKERGAMEYAKTEAENRAASLR